MEHWIQHAPGSERLLKITYPGQFGLRMAFNVQANQTPRRVSEALCLRPATPLEYLDRLALHNELFGRSVEFLGLVRWKDSWSMVISQIFLRGAKPTIAQIQSYMAANGFRKLGDENAYFRAQDSISVFDAHSRNFVLTEGVPVPFDVLPQRVDPRTAAMLSLCLGPSSKPPITRGMQQETRDPGP